MEPHPRARALPLCPALLRLDTPNPPGQESPPAELPAEALGGAGLEPRFYESEPGRTNVVARLRGSGSKAPMLLCAHLDVVPAEAARWTHPPFAGEIHDGYLWGRGA